MSSINIPGADQAAKAKFLQFAQGATTHKVALGIGTTQLAEIGAAANDFSTKLTDADAAKSAAAGAVDAKKKQRQTSTSVVRTYAQQFKNNPAATPAILSALGITPGTTSGGSLAPATDLTATAFTNGTANLSWKRNGNPRSAVFVIEAQIGGSSAWTWVGNTSKTRFVDGGATVGLPKLYRIRTQNAGATSAPSNTASIYSESGEEGLKLAA